MSLRHRIIPCIKHHVGNLVEKSSHFRLRNPVYKKMEPFTLTISDRKVKVKEHINVVYRDSCDSNITPTFTCEECKYFPFDTEEESEQHRNELLRRKSKAIAIVVESLQDMFKKEIGKRWLSNVRVSKMNREWFYTTPFFLEC